MGVADRRDSLYYKKYSGIGFFVGSPLTSCWHDNTLHYNLLVKLSALRLVLLQKQKNLFLNSHQIPKLQQHFHTWKDKFGQRLSIMIIISLKCTDWMQLLLPLGNVTKGTSSSIIIHHIRVCWLRCSSITLTCNNNLVLTRLLQLCHWSAIYSPL